MDLFLFSSNQKPVMEIKMAIEKGYVDGKIEQFFNDVELMVEKFD